MLAHLSSEETLMLNKSGFIWLQLFRRNRWHFCPCCPSFGTFIYEFDEYINSRGWYNWNIYLLPGNAGRFDHWFEKLWLVHNSRQDVTIPADAHNIYDHTGAFCDYDESPTQFIADGCCMWVQDGNVHTHVCMFYPLE